MRVRRRVSHDLEAGAHNSFRAGTWHPQGGMHRDSQVISNPDLEDLIVSVLDSMDSPADVRTLVMSRLLVMDIYLVLESRAVYPTRSGPVLEVSDSLVSDYAGGLSRN
ncbi:MAG: hypothetical protein ABR568_11635 [Pyrinomonadaceae bacterium]